MTDEVVTRLYRALVDELRARGHDESRPVKVSELYQTLVPYRTVRSALGVELNADYEHALLRLLAGERDLLRLEPEHAREELRREVSAPYPFVGLFRKFSASHVWVQLPAPEHEPVDAQPEAPREPARSGQREGSADPLPATAPVASARQVEPASPVEPPPTHAQPTPSAQRTPAHAQPTPSTQPEPPAADPDSSPDRLVAEAEPVRLRGGGGASAAPARPPVKLHQPVPEKPASERLTHVGTACAFCSEELPSGRRVRFCPHCGGDQRLQPCPRCDAVLEREWRYCISCGHDINAK